MSSRPPAAGAAGARCTLCPAGCPVVLVRSGPDAWRSEPPADGAVGLCPRGGALGQLLCHRRRIVSASRRVDGQRRSVDLAEAYQAVADAAGAAGVVVCLDANVPCEQIIAAAAWCEAWAGASLCVVMEPAERQLLLGIEAAGGEYLAADDLAGCDGFLIIGDVFAANPACARGVFERRDAQARTPIVAIDPAAGTAAKFATHRVDVAAGGEFSALSALASAAGLKEAPAGDNSSAEVAGKALAGCTRLGVLIAAEYARYAPWDRIGYLAGRLAAALGGGVAPQTTGANSLGALRLAERLGAVPLGEALGNDKVLLVAVGCDVSGMLGLTDRKVFAAAAPLPNASTASAEIVLPVAMQGEMSGTYLSGKGPVSVAALLEAPAGVPAPGELVGALAAAAGTARPQIPSGPGPLEPLDAAAPAADAAVPELPAVSLVLAAQAAHAGCGTLTGHGSWQAADEMPELRLAVSDAKAMNVRNLQVVTVRADGRSCRARVRVAPELPGGVMVLPAGCPAARALVPCRPSAALGASPDGGISAAPPAAEVIA